MSGILLAASALVTVVEKECTHRDRPARPRKLHPRLVATGRAGPQLKQAAVSVVKQPAAPASRLRISKVALSAAALSGMQTSSNSRAQSQHDARGDACRSPLHGTLWHSR